MTVRNMAWLLVVGVAIADAGLAAEAVKQDPAVPAAEQPGAPKGKPPGAAVFQPPPVPDFMLKKPARPLTLEEMQKQADEAAERSRRAREAGGTASPAQAPRTGATGNRSEPAGM